MLKSQDSILPLIQNEIIPENDIIDTRALINIPKNFQGGKIGQWSENWKILTSNSWVINTVEGSKIDFDEDVEGIPMLPPIPFSKREEKNVEIELEKLLAQNIIEETEHCEDEFISPIFLRPKKDGTHRLILNLKNLNKAVIYKHFKMESLKNAMNLTTQNCYFASIDLSQAYYACPVHPDHQKFLKFFWKNKLYKFVCFVNGLAEAPRKFSKIMKVPFSYLRKMGHASVAFIDDSLLISENYNECCMNIDDTIEVLDNLGFTIHPKKSVLYPTHRIVFLGYEIDSQKMSVKLTTEKVESTIELCEKLLNQYTCSIRELAKVVGKLVSAEPGVPLAPLFYKSLEREKTDLLSKNKGNYDAKIWISCEVKEHLKWWCNNLPGMYREIIPKNPEITIRSDSSDYAWGGVCLNTQQKVNGMWSNSEKKEHINFKELKAIFLCLKTFLNETNQVHVRVESDNTTAVAYINNFGGKIDYLDNLGREIWFWMIEKNCWISASYIPGCENDIADEESRIKKNCNTEWKLNEKVFQKIHKLWPYPEIDLFASRINKQLPKYVSWEPDPDSIAVDAFSFEWNDNNYYIFPPFSLINNILAKLDHDGGSSTLVAPIWPTQVWWVKLLQMTTEPPRLLGGKRLLTNPWNEKEEHPLRSQLKLGVFRVSGRNSCQRDYRSELPSWQKRPGVLRQQDSIGHISRGGTNFVCRGKLILIQHL